MPIVSDVGSIVNLIVNLFSRFFKLVSEKPQYLFILILILLFFPLEFVDAFLYAIINIFIAILNAIIIIVVLIVNSLIWIINGVYGVIVKAINFIIDRLEDVTRIVIAWIFIPINGIIGGVNNLTPWPFPDIPTISTPAVSFPVFSTTLLSEVSYDLTLSYFNINVFGTVGSGAYMAVLLSRDITSLFDVFGIASPMW